LVSFVDIETQRALQGLTLVFQGEFDIDEDATALLDLDVTSDDLASGDIGDLFDDEVFDLPGEPGPTDTGQDLSAILDLDDPIGNSDAEDESSVDGGSSEDSEEQAAAEEAESDSPRPGGSWHYILATVDDPRQADDLIADLNAWFESEGIAAQAGNWEAAAGPFATTADVVRTVFNVAIIIVGVVAVIIIMNTMVVSVIERTSEIGTMRALGAQRGFVWRMFLYETLTISAVFGIVGIILALIAIAILNAIGIPATNTFLQVLFAGPELRPDVSMTSIYGSVIIVTMIGILSHIYPVAVALKIQPIRAIQTE
jgi:putative ABC transport system permease protein